MRLLPLFILFLLGFTEKLFSQSISFEYDSSENQTKRKYDSAKKKSDEPIAQASYSEGFDYGVKVYPNPTSDVVNFSWSSPMDDQIKKIEYVHQSGSVYQEVAFNKGRKEVTINLSGQSIGVYLVVFFLKNGEKYSYKVLKH